MKVFRLVRAQCIQSFVLLRRAQPACFLPKPNPALFGPHEIQAMKRSNGFATASPAKKPKAKPRPAVPDYCDVEPLRNEDGAVIWPAASNAIEEAREFIREWYVSMSAQHLLFR